MASGFVHDVQSLIAFGRTYREIHRKKDVAAGRVPGLRHRAVRHGWYLVFGRRWDFDNPFPDFVTRRTQRIGELRGPERAEEYQASVCHDYFDRIWDFDDESRVERNFRRKYAEAFHIWLILNPTVLKEWAGVDVATGRIHRVVDGKEIWEEALDLKSEYERLRARAQFLLRCDRALRHMLEKYGRLPAQWNDGRLIHSSADRRGSVSSRLC